MKKTVGMILLVAGLVSPSLQAATPTNWGKITLYMTGWSVDQIRVQTTAAFINPASCSLVDGYMTDASDPGNHAHQATLLAAYANGKDVSLVIEGCNAYGRPKIVGVGIR